MILKTPVDRLSLRKECAFMKEIDFRYIHPMGGSATASIPALCSRLNAGQLRFLG